LSEPPAPIERTETGDFLLRLGPEERGLLRRLSAELEELLAAEPEDPSLRRLRPRAYEDEEVEREFRSLMGAELESLRLENLRRLAETAGRDRLDAEELDRWLAALNDLRLVLGTRLDVTEDQFADGFDPSAPHAYELAVYAFLTWLQEAAIDAASSGL
jgi:Rad3-related DNA helicase